MQLDANPDMSGQGIYIGGGVDGSMEKNLSCENECGSLLLNSKTGRC